MTELIVKAFVKDYENVKDASVRNSYGRLSGIVGIVCNVILFFGKLAAGVLSGSVSITADAFNSLADASSGLICLLGFKLASKPADRDHPYGHGRYEYISGLIVSALVMVIGVELLGTGIDKIISPEKVEFGVIPAAVLAVSALAKLWMMFFNKKLGRRINSQTLLATAADSRGDVISTCAVLLAAVISRFSGFELDGYAGVAVAVFIIINALGLIKETLDPILGKAPEPERVTEIRDRIMSYPEVIGMHDLILHDYGPGRQFGGVHVEMPAELDPLTAHDIIDNIERDFWEHEQLLLIVHYDPIASDPETEEFRAWLEENIKTVGHTLTVHDVRMVKGVTHTNVIFDCVCPHEEKLTESELRAAVTSLIVESYPDYRAVITVDRDYSPIR